LALESTREILYIDHLQMNIKLRKSEIDALFLAVERRKSGESRELLVTCEAKTRNDDILPDQILNQVKAIFAHPGINQELVIPIAIKTIRPSEVYLVEFEPVTRQQANSLMALNVVSTALYELVPDVPGIA